MKGDKRNGGIFTAGKSLPAELQQPRVPRTCHHPTTTPPPPSCICLKVCPCLQCCYQLIKLCIVSIVRTGPAGCSSIFFPAACYRLRLHFRVSSFCFSCACACSCMCVCVYVYVCVCMCVCVCVCVCMWGGGDVIIRVNTMTVISLVGLTHQFFQAWIDSCDCMGSRNSGLLYLNSTCKSNHIATCDTSNGQCNHWRLPRK